MSFYSYNVALPAKRNFPWLRFHRAIATDASGLDGIIPQNTTEKFHPYLVGPIAHTMQCIEYDERSQAKGISELQSSGRPVLLENSVIDGRMQFIRKVRYRTYGCRGSLDAS